MMVEHPKKPQLPGFLNLGTMIGLCAAAGIVFGFAFGNPTWGMLVGAALGTVAGAVLEAGRRSQL
jgi:uncharacterized membrane protein